MAVLRTAFEPKVWPILETIQFDEQLVEASIVVVELEQGVSTGLDVPLQSPDALTYA